MLRGDAFDLDLIKPPGTADDLMMNFHPATTVTREDKLIRTGRDNGKDEAQSSDNKPVKTKVMTRKKPILPPKAPPPLTISIADISPIPTIDFPVHAESGWACAVNVGVDPVADGLGYMDDYMRRAKFEAYLRCFSRVLIDLFHNNRVFDHDEIIFYTLFGDPAAPYAVKCGNLGAKAYEAFSDRVIKYIGAETSPPELPAVDRTYETMMRRIVTLELISSFPFTESIPFAPGLDNFPREEIYPFVKKMLESKNKRVRRNAVYYLGTMQKVEPSEDLMNVLKTTTDNVEKHRALFFLTQAKYAGLIDYLIDRLKTETDPVFVTAIINSLRKLADKKAFPALVGRLKDAADDFEVHLNLIKACVACIDKKDRDNFKWFHSYLKMLYGTLSDHKWTSDPLAIIVVDSYQSGARIKTLKQAIEISLAVCGDAEALGELASRLKSIGDKLDTAIRDPSGLVVDLALSHYIETIRSFLVESLPSIPGGKSFLEKLLISGFEHDNILMTALNTYYRAYPDDFGKLGLKMLNKELPVLLQDRIIKYLFMTGNYGDKVTELLKKIIAKYSPTLKDYEKHPVTLSIFFIVRDNGLKDADLISIVARELAAAENASPTLPEQQPVLNISIRPLNHLIGIAVELLGMMRTSKAEVFLVSLSGTKDVALKRTVAKALGNFNSDQAKEVLFKLLEDTDNWTRLIAYKSLNRATRVDHNVDWFFATPEELKARIVEYRKKISVNK